MKILLATPPFSEEERYGNLSKVGTLYPPLGLAYIAAIAEKEGHTVKVVESEALGYAYDDIYSQVDKFKPDLIGMPTFLNTIDRCFIVAKKIREDFPKIKVILGGVQATLDPNYAIKNDFVDFVILGEGEIPFKELLSALEGKIPFREIRGLVWKDNGDIISNQPQALIQNLDILPFPARHLFPMERYHSSSQLRGKHTLHLMSARGCPFRCAYCASHLTFGKTFRYQSTPRTIQELLILKNEYHADTVQFYDETFTLNKKRVIDLCDEMIREKLNLPWSCFTRVNVVDLELLKKMKAAGCYQIFYGVEAATQRLLDIIKKDITLEQIEKAFKWTKQAGIQTLASFMIGLPTETVEEAYKTIDFAIKLDTDYASWEKTTPFPGTEMFDICEKHGEILTRDWTRFTGWNELVYVTKGRTKEDILKIEKAAFVKFYLRPKYIIKRIPMFLKLRPRRVFNLFVTGLKLLRKSIFER